MSVDDLRCLLRHHWVHDQEKYPTERQRIQMSLCCCWPVSQLRDPEPSSRVDVEKAASKLCNIATLNSCWSLIQCQVNGIRGSWRLRLCLWKVIIEAQIRMFNQIFFELNMYKIDWILEKTFTVHEDDDPVLCQFSSFLQSRSPTKLLPPTIYNLLISLTTCEWAPLRCQIFHWEESMQSVPVFRQPIQVAEGIRTSPDRAWKYENFHSSLKSLGLATGFQASSLFMW